jgi:hypothetical protein
MQIPEVFISVSLQSDAAAMPTYETKQVTFTFNLFQHHQKYLINFSSEMSSL